MTGTVLHHNNVVSMTDRPEFPFSNVLSTLTPNVAADMLRYGWTKPGILSLAQGEGSWTTPAEVIEATHKALSEGKTFYAPVLGIPELRQELANYYAAHYQINIPTNRLFVTSSGTTAMHLAMTSILEEGDEVVAVTPIWKNLLGAIELAQAKTVQVALDFSDETGWTLDLDKLFDAVTSKTKALLIVTPSNPTGWTMAAKQIGQVLEFARSKGLWIIADEVYGRIVYDGVHAPSFLEQSKPDDKLYVVNSFSKAYAMTGWRLGWLVGPAYAENTVRDVALYDNMGPPTYAQYGAVAALRHGEAFLKNQLDLWRKNRDTVARRLGQNNRIRYVSPESTFYAFFAVEGEEDCLAFAKHLIDESLLSLAPGGSFGQCCKGWMRMCFAVSEEKLEDALNRLEQGLAKRV